MRFPFGVLPGFYTVLLGCRASIRAVSGVLPVVVTGLESVG